MKTFTKWFVFNAMVFTAAVGGWKQGVFQIIIENDSSYIALVCMVLYVAFTVYLGKVALLIDRAKEDNAVLNDKLQPAYFMAELFLSLGLLGTTAGLAYTIQLLGISKGANVDPSKLMTMLPEGVGRTLYTTITAIACQILLQVQLFPLSQKLNKKNGNLP